MLNEDQIKETLQMFLKSAQDGNTFLFTTLLEKLTSQDPLLAHIDIKDIVDEKLGANVLHWAAFNGHLPIVKLLVEKKPELINTRTSNGSTPLLNSVFKDHDDIAIYLLEHNALPRILNDDKENAFSLAAKKPDKNYIKKYLAEYLDLLNMNFMLAILKDDQELAKEWLDKGADIETPVRNVSETYAVYTALFHACTTGKLELAKFLISLGANMNVIGAKNGFAPLHGAINFGYPEIARLLIAAGADITLKDGNGSTPLDIAQTRKLTEIIKLLEPKKETPALPYSEPKNSYVPNSLFANKKEPTPTPAKKIKFDELQATIDKFLPHINKIEQAGIECLTAFNAKCLAGGYDNLPVKISKIEKYVKYLRETYQTLHDDFHAENASINVPKKIKAKHKYQNQLLDMEGYTINMDTLLDGNIIPSQEYGKAYSTLFDEMRALRDEATKLNRKLEKINNNELEVVSESTLVSCKR